MAHLAFSSLASSLGSSFLTTCQARAAVNIPVLGEPETKNIFESPMISSREFSGTLRKSFWGSPEGLRVWMYTLQTLLDPNLIDRAMNPTLGTVW